MRLPPQRHSSGLGMGGVRPCSILFAIICVTACGRPTPSAAPTSPPSDREPTAEAKADFERAVATYEAAKKDGELDDAECKRVVRAFEAVFDEHGASMAIAGFDAGATLEACGHPDQARAAYEKVIAVHPGFAPAHNNLAVMAFRRGDEASAMRHLDAAVKADPTSRAPRNNLAALLHERYAGQGGDAEFTRAEQELQNVLAVDSSNRLAYENLARLYYERGQRGQRSYLLLANLVVTQGLRIVERDGADSAQLHNLRGLILMQHDDQVRALRAFLRATEIDPAHAAAHKNAAMIAIRFRDYALAERSLEAAAAVPDNQRRRQDDVELYLSLGVAKRGLRKYAEAEQAFERANALASNDPRPLYNLGILYQEHIAPSREKFSEKPYRRAQRYFDAFAKTAASRHNLRSSVADAQRRITQIDELIAAVRDLEALEAENRRLQQQAEADRLREKKRLLELERQVRQHQ